tara:strand:+ start:135 stop:428 length:294 start_codon:yes stop_codon:yes gene_type:complete
MTSPNTWISLKSKKFIAYLIAEAGWKIGFFYMLYIYQDKIEHYSFMVLVTLIIVSGFIQVGYILGQAALDKYLHVADKLTVDAKIEQVAKKAKENIK